MSDDDETVTMVGPNGQVVEGVDRETAAAATGLLADIETRITAAYEQGKEVGRVNGAARLAEAKRFADNADAARRETHRQLNKVQAELAILREDRDSEGRWADDYADALTLVRKQRDALIKLLTDLPFDVPDDVPCGEGFCNCGGCAL